MKNQGQRPSPKLGNTLEEFVRLFKDGEGVEGVTTAWLVMEISSSSTGPSSKALSLEGCMDFPSADILVAA